MKEKPPFYKLKLCERIVDIELLVLLLYAIIFIVIIWKRGGQFIWYDVLINIGSGILSSIAVTLFIYFKFLKHVPEETEKKINALLNARLGYETTNHNAVMAAVNPSNAYLSQEHTRLSQEHQQLNAGISSIDKAISVEIQKACGLAEQSDRRTKVYQRTHQRAFRTKRSDEKPANGKQRIEKGNHRPASGKSAFIRKTSTEPTKHFKRPPSQPVTKNF